MQTLIAVHAEPKCTKNGETKTNKEKMKKDVNITINGKQMEIQFQDDFWRDCFAAAALTGLMNRDSNQRSLAEQDAEYCFAIADAMIQARKGSDQS